MATNPNTNNNQQGGLLRRVSNNNTQNNTHNNQTPLTNNQNNNNTLRSRPGNNNNRFNNNQESAKPTWTITPTGAGVHLAFLGIGDPLARILGRPLDKSLNDVNIFAHKLANDDELHKQLVSRLDEVWSTYGYCGATILHPIRENIQEAFMSGTMPIIEPDQTDTNDNGNNTVNNNLTPASAYPQQTPVAPYRIYRAIDATFVLNVLGRARGSVLVEDTPLALEIGFLNQSYICDDPRIVDLALATGAI